MDLTLCTLLQVYCCYITIVIGGILYTTSAGDSGKVTKAKNMITYSIVGLVVVLAAFAITNLLLGGFHNETT